MVSTLENEVDISKDRNGLAKRLLAFMKTHDLSVEDLARLLRTPPEILHDWLNEDMPPPACLVALMVLVQILPQERSQPRANSNGYGISDKDREEALRRAQAI
ncbi:MAG: hypothetical protein ACLPWS_08360 [Rhodomicrobium sp.]